MKHSTGTFTGGMLDLLDPRPEQVDIESIAWGLAGVYRFAAQAHTRYTVAEHSILVSRLVPKQLAKAALLHDAAEAYLGDVATPVKALLPDYRAVYERVEAAIAARFGVNFDDRRIKSADNQALYMERVHHTNKLWEWGDKPRGWLALAPRPPQYGDPFAAFLARWAEVRCEP